MAEEATATTEKNKKSWVIWVSIIGIIIIIALVVGLSIGLSKDSTTSKTVNYEIYVDTQISAGTDDSLPTVDTGSQSPVYTYSYTSDNGDSTIAEDNIAYINDHPEFILDITGTSGTNQLVSLTLDVDSSGDANTGDLQYVLIDDTASGFGLDGLQLDETLGLIDTSVSDPIAFGNIETIDGSIVTEDAMTYSIVFMTAFTTL